MWEFGNRGAHLYHLRGEGSDTDGEKQPRKPPDRQSAHLYHLEW